MTNIGQFVGAVAEIEPGRTALIIDDGRVCTYGELRDEIERWAAMLAGAGIGPGDRVALADWGGVRSAAVTLAAARLGAATAQMNPLLTAGELGQLAVLAECASTGVATDGARSALAEALGQLGRGQGAVLQRPGPEQLGTSADGGGADALVLFTSGTTGLPKPVPISHDAIDGRVRAYRQPFSGDRAPGVSIMCVPSFHVGGMLGLLLSLYSGDTTVIQPRFDPGRWLELVSRHRVASAFLVPTMLARILDHPACPTTDLSSLVSVSYGAAAAPVELVRRAMAAWPQAGFANTFGQTETLGAYTTLSPADHRDPIRIGSVGRALPGVEIRVVDPGTGHDVVPGQVGELWVQGVQNVRGGWLHTGDLGRIDGDGYLYPTGRLSDTINRGGEKFGPSEVADVLRTHPAVADVGVAGVPDPEMGERVGVAAVARAGVEPPSDLELREWCRSRLAPFKLPEVIVWVDALPYNELGKLTRRATAALIVSQAGSRP